ncbi:MAG TPA: TetR/AcrR family transcriptional regulator, partial [Microthrixaceae bacterium]|nr:TetR/AcrR family transcriptional regulator [Microthrixaceae bacterium]
RRGQMHLFAHHRVELPPTDTDTTPSVPTETVGDVLRDIYRSQVDQITATWQRLLSLGEMRLAEPFDTRRLAVAVHALLLGLEIVHAVDPDAVDDNLFAEATATLAAALSRLDLDPARVMTAAELGQTEATTPQARSGARRRLDTRRRIVAAATGMFDSGWDHVSAKEIGATAGVSTQTVINLFGNVRRVCAATFVRHLPAVEAALGSTGQDRPRAGIAAALGVIADAAAGDPHPARALLAERVGVRVERGFELDDDDIRVIVPIGIRIAQQITRVTGLDIASPHVPDLSSLVVDFTLGHAVPRPDSRDDTVRRAMALLDDALGELPIDSEPPGVPHYSDDPSDLRHDTPDARGNGRLQ